MSATDPISLRRECEVVEIPSGVRCHLDAGTRVRVMQSLAGGYIVATDHGVRYRLDAREADALGLSAEAVKDAPRIGSIQETHIWEQLKSVYDPEIPVNIVDLGLIYSAAITPIEGGGKRIEVRMSMTSPGCGMANVLKTDVESKLLLLPEIKEVKVEVVFDPPWHPKMMSEEAKLQLGFDLDYGMDSSSTSDFRILR
jgi:probable FeS assembly SUF system protein SufT